jgi:pilus assembly protein CpaE
MTTGRLKILIADHSLSSRMATRDFLSQQPELEVIAAVADGRQAVRLALNHRPDVVLLDEAIPGVDSLEAVRTIVSKAEGVQVIIMGEEMKADALRLAMQAGARDFIRKDSPGQEFLAAIGNACGLTRARQEVALEGGPAISQLVTVAAAKDGSGKSVLAANLAVALASRKTVLLDLHAQFGDLAFMLNLAPAKCLADLMPSHLEDIDAEMVESHLLQHESGIKVLAATQKSEDLGLLKLPHMARILEILRERYAFVIADLPSVLDPAVVYMLEQSSRVLFVTALQNLASLKNGKWFFDALRTFNLHLEKVAVIATKTSRHADIGEHEVKKAFGLPVAAWMPKDEDLVTSSINLGKPFVLTHPKHALSRAVQQIAATLEQEAEPAAKPVAVGK